MASNFNWVDYIIIGIFLFSILGGLLRGGVREIFALITWIAAFFVAGMFAAPVANYFSGTSKVQSAFSSASSGMSMSGADHASMLATGISFVVLFFGTILIGTIIGRTASHIAEGGGISLVNRLFGALFGLGRGYLINLVIVFVVQMTPVSQQSYWTASQLVTRYQPAVTWFANFVQPGIEKLKSSVGQSFDKFNQENTDTSVKMFQDNSRN